MDDELQPQPAGVDATGLYRDMVLSRRLDTEAIALQRQGELGLWASPLGQEAAQVGAARSMRPQDVAFPTYREHAVALCRGIDPVELLGLFRGTTLGGWDPAVSGVQLYSIVIGAQALHGVGYAMGIVRDGDVGTGDPDRDRAVLVFVGDGALSEGETNEAFVWAGAQGLPVVFFCQNNQFAISTPNSVQSRVPAAQRAEGFGFGGERVDGNDVFACLSATGRALDRARRGEGPSLIEALTYRRNPHTTSDDDGRYRSGPDKDVWVARDPVERLHGHLRATGQLNDDREAEIAREEADLAQRVRAGCRALDPPEVAAPFLNTYADLPAELADQLRDHLAYVAAGQPDEPDRPDQSDQPDQPDQPDRSGRGAQR